MSVVIHNEALFTLTLFPWLALFQSASQKKEKEIWKNWGGFLFIKYMKNKNFFYIM